MQQIKTHELQGCIEKFSSILKVTNLIQVLHKALIKCTLRVFMHYFVTKATSDAAAIDQSKSWFGRVEQPLNMNYFQNMSNLHL